jgi:hypothetical protein
VARRIALASRRSSRFCSALRPSRARSADCNQTGATSGPTRWARQRRFQPAEEFLGTARLPPSCPSRSQVSRPATCRGLRCRWPPGGRRRAGVWHHGREGCRPQLRPATAHVLGLRAAHGRGSRNERCSRHPPGDRGTGQIHRATRTPAGCATRMARRSIRGRACVRSSDRHGPGTLGQPPAGRSRRGSAAPGRRRPPPAAGSGPPEVRCGDLQPDGRRLETLVSGRRP